MATKITTPHSRTELVFILILPQRASLHSQLKLNVILQPPTFSLSVLKHLNSLVRATNSGDRLMTSSAILTLIMPWPERQHVSLTLDPTCPDRGLRLIFNQRIYPWMH